MTFREQLIKLNACADSIEWIGDKSFKEAWEQCDRGDWMLWIFKKLYPENLRELTLAKGHCANTVRHLMKDEISIKAVDTAIAFGEGKATIEELKDAADAAYAAYAAAPAASTAAVAYAAYVAAAAADAAVADAPAAVAAAAADICRKFLNPKF